MYDNVTPSEAQLRGALAALALPVPQEIDDLEDGERKAALAAHLLRAATRATHNLVNAAPGLGEAARRAKAVFPHGWPIPENHWTTARIELAFPADRLAMLLDDQHTDAAVTMDDPDSDQGEDGGIEQIEAHAAGAWAAVEAAGALIDLRNGPASSPQFAGAALDLIGDQVSRLDAAYHALARHHRHEVSPLR
ncbi:hypothetical protein [Streptomyces sp. NPDC048191]|uniref:hypothetical protein n=1 Tax=Streptomyces sp. NPDC048191 TaxID=3155484 RepID=UPI003402CE60